MARMRSPNYPSIALRQAVELVGKIHSLNRTNVIDRETAVRDMGYSAISGRSLKVLAALIQFGLLAKAGAGSVKVTPSAVAILHGIDERDRKAALLKAAFEPSLFRTIHERFPEGIPSENAIRSFLIQQEFADVAIGPAIRSFLETYESIENLLPSDEGSADGEAEAQLALTDEASRLEPSRAIAPAAGPGNAPNPHGGYRVADGERVVFSEEIGADQYLKLVAAGEMNDILLEALEDYIKRQRRRLTGHQAPEVSPGG